MHTKQRRKLEHDSDGGAGQALVVCYCSGHTLVSGSGRCYLDPVLLVKHLDAVVVAVEYHEPTTAT